MNLDAPVYRILQSSFFEFKPCCENIILVKHKKYWRRCKSCNTRHFMGSGACFRCQFDRRLVNMKWCLDCYIAIYPNLTAKSIRFNQKKFVDMIK